MVALLAVPTTFAQYLDRVMQERRIGPTEIAEYSGVSVNTVKDWQRGYREPQPATLRKLARGLRVPLREVFAAAYPLDEDENEIDTFYEEAARDFERLMAEGQAFFRRLRERRHQNGESTAG